MMIAKIKNLSHKVKQDDKLKLSQKLLYIKMSHMVKEKILERNKLKGGEKKPYKEKKN